MKEPKMGSTCSFDGVY